MDQKNHTLWVEKYRPSTIDEYVWRDDAQKSQVLKWVNEGNIPTLLLSGKPGTGKTSLARLLIRLLGVNPGDVMEINASRERKVDDIQDKISNFASTWPIGEYKYIILDEADSMSPLAQRMLRADIENYSDSCRFIFTANYPNKIIPALHSRCQGFHFEELDQDLFTSRVLEIALNEGVRLDTEDDVMRVDEIVDASYPDLRKCINLLQQQVVDGIVTRLQKDDSGGKDYMFDMANLFKQGKYMDARKMVVSQIQPEEYEEMYRFMYQNLDIWGDTEEKQNEAILIIRKGLVNHSLVADVEINLSATFVELSNIARS